MATPYEKELRQFVEAVILPKLQGAGYGARLDEKTLREYHVKVSTDYQGMEIGHLIVYYAPSSGTFSVKCHEIRDKTLLPSLEKLFPSAVPNKEKSSKKISAPPVQQGVSIYVDGSYLSGRVGYGVVILRDGKPIHELFGRVYEDTETRQVAGELMATINALTWCVQEAIAQVALYHDYTGVAMWATGRWTANTPLTQNYQAFMRECPVKVKFYKVASHTGDKWNEYADQLAKQGAKIK